MLARSGGDLHPAVKAFPGASLIRSEWGDQGASALISARPPRAVVRGGRSTDAEGEREGLWGKTLVASIYPSHLLFFVGCASYVRCWALSGSSRAQGMCLSLAVPCAWPGL